MRYGTNVDKIKIMDFFIHSTYDNITNLIPRVLSLPHEKVPWFIQLVRCLYMPTQATQRVGSQLNFVITV